MMTKSLRLILRWLWQILCLIKISEETIWGCAEVWHHKATVGRPGSGWRRCLCLIVLNTIMSFSSHYVLILHYFVRLASPNSWVFFLLTHGIIALPGRGGCAAAHGEGGRLGEGDWVGDQPQGGAAERDLFSQICINEYITYDKKIIQGGPLSPRGWRHRSSADGRHFACRFKLPPGSQHVVALFSTSRGIGRQARCFLCTVINIKI